MPLSVELNHSITVYWTLILIVHFRDWSKSIGRDGPGQRGGESCNFQLPMGVGHPIFLRGIDTHLSANLQVNFQ